MQRYGVQINLLGNKEKASEISKEFVKNFGTMKHEC